MDDLVEQYKKLHQDTVRLEGALEATRAQRGLVAGQLLARDGKGVVYDMGDGVDQIVCLTKVGTHYLVARNKWVKRAGVAKPPGEPKPAKGKKGSGKQPKPKRAIVNGQIVDLAGPRAPGRPTPKAPKKALPTAVSEAPVAEPVVAEPEAVETSVAPEAQAPVAEAEPSTVEASPAVAPPEPELDPLDAALAALDLL